MSENSMPIRARLDNNLLLLSMVAEIKMGLINIASAIVEDDYNSPEDALSEIVELIYKATQTEIVASGWMAGVVPTT